MEKTEVQGKKTSKIGQLSVVRRPQRAATIILLANNICYIVIVGIFLMIK